MATENRAGPRGTLDELFLEKTTEELHSLVGRQKDRTINESHDCKYQEKSSNVQRCALSIELR